MFLLLFLGDTLLKFDSTFYYQQRYVMWQTYEKIGLATLEMLVGGKRNRPQL